MLSNRNIFLFVFTICAVGTLSFGSLLANSEGSAVLKGTVNQKTLSPMIIEISDLITMEKQKLQELSKQSKTAIDITAILAIQKEISTVKFEMEINILKIQANYAQQAGRTELVVLIEEQIKSMGLTLEKSAAPTERSRSTDNSERN